jgi:hypothetical protein
MLTLVLIISLLNLGLNVVAVLQRRKAIKLHERRVDG